MASNGAPKVYRATNLPHHVDRLAAAALLTQCIPGTSLEDIQIESLAPVVDPWANESTKVATLRFKSAPAALTQDSNRIEWSFPMLGSRSPITLDIHFYGLTPLNEVNENSHTDDCIVISGLASHPMGSWQPRGDKSFMWIRDALPSRFPGVRFILYGYDTALWRSRSFQVVPDIAGSFISELKANGCAAPAAKPLIFLAHSLGGVVLKQSMVMLAGSGVRERHIIRNIKGAIFFGVPSVGMAVPDIYEMLEDQPNTALLDYLSNHSDYVPTLEKQFDGISYTRDMVLFWAYETQATPSLSNSSGGWKRSGPDTVMVSPESATGGRHGISPERLLQIDADHSNMVKFRPGDRLIPILADKIREIIDNAMIHASTKTPGRVISGRPANRSKRPESNLFTGKKIMKTSKILTNDIPWFSQVLRKSLLAPERDLRLYDIDENTKSTFGWVYDHPDINLASWLLKGEGIFWLSGKPGSGKSTMMKFIWNDPRTGELLHRWGSKHQQILINFFFHHRGSVIQKSFEGLIQSILYQIIGKEPQLCTLLEGIVEKTFPQNIASWREAIDHAEPEEVQAKLKESRAKLKRAHAKLKEDRADLDDDSDLEVDTDLELPARLWTRRALEECLYALLLQDKFDLDLFLLLDALDEYDGRPEFIADFLKRMTDSSSRTRVRILFSSRPWKVFQDEFDSCPGFKIHEYTEDDIRRFTVQSVPPGAGVLLGLTEQIVHRSQGVFLWVKLVMRQLSAVVAEPWQENPDGQPLSFRLEKKLRELPDQLDEFYYTIVERIPDVFRWDTYVLLECMVRSRENLNIEEALRLLDLSKEATSVDWGKYLDGKRNLSTKETAKGVHQLKAISGGLLEISQPNRRTFYDVVDWYNENSPTEGPIHWDDSSLPIIQFMHQTVQEFVQEPGFRHAILGLRGKTTNANGHSFMTEYLFHQNVFPGARNTTAFHGTEAEKMEHLLPLFFHAREAEKTTGTGQPFLISDRTILDDWTPLTFCVAAGLRLLLRGILRKHEDAISKCKGGLLPTILLSLKKRYLEPADAIQMTVDLVENGYRIEKDIDSMHELFVKIWKNRLYHVTTATEEDVCSRRDYIALTSEALKGFTDQTILFRKRDSKFSLIHRCPPELISQILALGVNPNSGGHAGGHSVLDSFILNISPIDTIFIDSAIYDAFKALIHHGAVLHTTKRRIWEDLIQRFADRGYDMSFLPEYPSLKSSHLRSFIAETMPASNSEPDMPAEQGKGVAKPGRSRFSEKLKRLSTSFQMSTIKRGDKEKKFKASATGTGSETTSLV